MARAENVLISERNGLCDPGNRIIPEPEKTEKDENTEKIVAFLGMYVKRNVSTTNRNYLFNASLSPGRGKLVLI